LFSKGTKKLANNASGLFSVFVWMEDDDLMLMGSWDSIEYRRWWVEE
jgi:hypothetical protein